jgi:hypothetical protein
MPIQNPTNVDYLIDYLRLRVGDTNPTAYRYTDEWLRTALVLSMKNLQRYQNNKYLIDADSNIYRNPHIAFLTPETDGIIEERDEPVIVLMAAIIVLEGSLENSAWDAVSWKDAEISYSNLEQFRSRDASLRRLIDELNDLILPPRKRLAKIKKQSLPGYKGNPFEQGD